MNILSFTINLRAKIAGGFMTKRGRARKTNSGVESVSRNDPLKRAEGLFKEFKAAADAAILSVNSAVGREARDSAVAEAIAVCRRSYAFGYALSQATMKTAYRVSDKPLRELKIQSRKLLLAPTPLPDEALGVLEALKATMPPPKIFEGEAEYQKWLKEKRMTEVDEKSDQTWRRDKFLSID
jgi:hypothetical protein